MCSYFNLQNHQPSTKDKDQKPSYLELKCMNPILGDCLAQRKCQSLSKYEAKEHCPNLILAS